jgi:hypothetical protein
MACKVCAFVNDQLDESVLAALAQHCGMLSHFRLGKSCRKVMWLSLKLLIVNHLVVV